MAPSKWPHHGTPQATTLASRKTATPWSTAPVIPGLSRILEPSLAEGQYYLPSNKNAPLAEKIQWVGCNVMALMTDMDGL